MSKSLVTLLDEHNEIQRLLFQSGGEITEEVEQKLMVNAAELPKKIEGYSFMLDRIPLEIKYAEDQAAAFTKLAKSFKGVLSRLKGNIKFAMDVLQVKEIAGESVRFKLQKSPPSMEIDEKLLPEEYFMIIPETKVPDRQKIKDKLKDGWIIEGAHLIQSDRLRKYSKGAK